MSFTKLNYHIVFSTKERQPFITDDLRPRLHEYLGGCIREARGASLRIGGTADHVHMLAGLRPTHCLADVIRDIKRASSKWIHDLTRNRVFDWQDGYGAFTVSPHDVDGLIRYIDGQEEHHHHRTFRDEYAELLREHGIEFDERYLR